MNRFMPWLIAFMLGALLIQSRSHSERKQELLEEATYCMQKQTELLLNQNTFIISLKDRVRQQQETIEAQRNQIGFVNQHIHLMSR